MPASHEVCGDSNPLPGEQFAWMPSANSPMFDLAMVHLHVYRSFDDPHETISCCAVGSKLNPPYEASCGYVVRSTDGGRPTTGLVGPPVRRATEEEYAEAVQLYAWVPAVRRRLYIRPRVRRWVYRSVDIPGATVVGGVAETKSSRPFGTSSRTVRATMQGQPTDGRVFGLPIRAATLAEAKQSEEERSDAATSTDNAPETPREGELCLARR